MVSQELRYKHSQGRRNDAETYVETILLDTPDSFLDVFYLGEEAKDNGDPALVSSEKTKRPDEKSSMTKIMGGSARDTRAKGSVEDKERSRWMWLIIGAVALLSLALFGMYLKGATERRLQGMLAKGEYRQGAILTNNYLKKQPENQRIRDLAMEALAKSTIPDWSEKLNNKSFSDAETVLVDARRLSQFNTDGLEMLDLLSWITDLEEFLAKRGRQTPLVIFQHEEQIERLLQRWETDPQRYRHLLARIPGYVPDFDQVRSRTFSGLSKLRNEKSTYLVAIENLKSALQEKLHEKHTDELEMLLRDFKKKYPRVGGIEDLQNDLKKYIAIRKIQARTLVGFWRLLNVVDFETPPFQQKARNWMEKAPPTTIVRGYEQAQEAWRSGQYDRAVAIMEPLTQMPWGEVAAKKLEHFKRVRKELQALERARGTNDYAERLSAFYTSVVGAGDRFFLQVIEDDLQLHKERAMSNVRKSLPLAQQHWEKYLEEGSIGGMLRLEKNISKTFKRRARLLSDAYNQAYHAIHLCELWQITCPSVLTTLHDEIRSEISRQREWLNDLSIVLHPSLLTEKLKLFAEPHEARS